MMRLSLIVIVSVLGAGTALGKTTVLSSEKDTIKDGAVRAVRGYDEGTSFWGMAGLLGGTKREAAAPPDTAAAALTQFAGKGGRFYTAAFLLSVKGREDVLEIFALDGRASSTALAAAALSMRATGDFLKAERAANAVEVTHYDEMGVEINLKANRVGKKKGKLKGKKSAKGPTLPHLRVLLASSDPLTLYLALQAAAYSKDTSVSELVSGIEAVNGEIAAAKLFYTAMTGGSLSTNEVRVAAVQAAKGMSRGAGGSVPGFDLNLPGLCFVCKAIEQAGLPEAAPILSKALSTGDPRVQIDAVRAIAATRAESCLPELSKLIATAPWPVLLEACHAAGAIPDSRMIPGLIQRLGKEKGRLRLDLVHALSSIVGEQKGADAKEWTEWWVANKTTFEVDPAATEAYRKKVRVQDVVVPGVGFFYGLSIYSDHFCYVVDSSLSMRGNRIASLKENLTGSIEGLAAFANYNIVDFGGDVEVMVEGGLTTNKRTGTKRVYDMDMSLGTRSFCSLRQGVMLPDCDTIYFLSDGAPAMDSMSTWSEIRRAVLMMTRYARTAVYCIDFDPSASNQANMIYLADENIGLHESIWVGPAGDMDLGGAASKQRKKK